MISSDLNSNSNSNSNSNANEECKTQKCKNKPSVNLSINNGEEEDEEEEQDEDDNEDDDIVQLVEMFCINAHKSVLSCSSSVFHAMLTNHLKERDENHIVIDDICYQTMHHLLRYMYTNKVAPDCDLKALFAAAEKYAIYDLCRVCLQRMQLIVSEQTVCGLLVFVQRYQNNHHIDVQRMKKFETDLFQFMVDHYPSISKLASYQKLKSKIEGKLTMFMYQKQFGSNK